MALRFKSSLTLGDIKPRLEAFPDKSTQGVAVSRVGWSRLLDEEAKNSTTKNAAPNMARKPMQTATIQAYTGHVIARSVWTHCRFESVSKHHTVPYTP